MNMQTFPLRTGQNITKRFDLNVGKRCNERCTFCYYLDEIVSGDTRDLSTEQIKEVLRVGRRWGKDRVDITGGEPSIRKDLPDIIDYARSIGYQTRCIITNALATASERKLQQLVDAGLNDILISLHAYDAESHDDLVKVKGAHEKVLKTIANAKKIGINFRINHVVNNLNFKNVMKLADLVADYEPAALNFIVFNPTRDAADASVECGITYEEVAARLREVLDKYDDKIPSINIRHMPFCFLKGYEKNIKTMWQLQYEKVEWDWCMDIIHKRGALFMYGASLVGMAAMLIHPRFYKTSWSTRIHDALQYSRIMNDRAKTKACKRCDMRYICDGLPKEYVKDHGDKGVVPYEGGQVIKDPTHFIPKSELEDDLLASDHEVLPDTPRMWFGRHKKSNNDVAWNKKIIHKLKENEKVIQQLKVNETVSK